MIKLGQKTKILSIDDEFAALIKMKILFADYGECETATTANQAISLFNSAISLNDPFTLITFDIEMPMMSGVDLMKKIHDLEEKRGINPSVKIMVTAASTPANLKASMENCCNGFLVKPLRQRVVEDTLKRFDIFKIGDKLDGQAL